MPKSYENSIARRLYFSREGKSSAAKPAVNVAFIGIVVGVAVMIVSLCIVVGFKHTVTEKVAGFGAHIEIVNFDNNNTYELQPIAVTDSLLTRLRSIEHVESVAPFATKPGILKTDSAFQGVVYKGTDEKSFYRSNLVQGAMPNGPKEVLISSSLARLMQLEVGDALTCWFVDETALVRRFVISGLYETGMTEFDNLFVIGDIEVVQRLNGWTNEQVGGVEIRATELQYITEVEDKVWRMTANKLDQDGNAYYVLNLVQQNPAIFAWLDLLDTNVIIIIILMLVVSAFSIVSGLIILILDSVNVIGLFKALGADNGFIRRIFRRQAACLIGKGLLYGNVIGLGLTAIQYYTHLIPLDAATYYVSYVPIAFPWLLIVGLNVLTGIVSSLVLIGPSYIVTCISPARTLQFE